MMIRILKKLKNIQLYTTEKGRKLRAFEVRKLTGADLVINGSLFDYGSWRPLCDVKAGGKVLSDDPYEYRGLAWNSGDDHFTVARTKEMGAWENFLSCVFLIHEGRALPFSVDGAVGRRAARSAVFETKQGETGVFCSKERLSPRELQRRLLDRGDVSWALMLDGGGSVQLSQEGPDYLYSPRRVQNYLCFWESTGEAEEPKGEKPMVEINAYSKAKDGEKPLSAHFKVKEFACRDGSDAILTAPRLVMVLESVRSHFGTPLIIHSGYRTPQYNKSVGGTAHSQHCYGTAADISLRDVSPKAVADFARGLMPDWGGVGIYSDKGFTHLDVRETKADWGK